MVFLQSLKNIPYFMLRSLHDGRRGRFATVVARRVQLQGVFKPYNHLFRSFWFVAPPEMIY